jgi:hypothetical protein
MPFEGREDDTGHHPFSETSNLPTNLFGRFLTPAPGHEGTIFDGITHDGPPADACCGAQAQRPFRSPHSYLVLTTGRPVGALRCAPARSPTCRDSCDRHP